SKYKIEDIQYFLEMTNKKNYSLSETERLVHKKYGRPQFRISDRTNKEILSAL
ncbi:MAG: hypothetical protein ACJA1M_000783, partial [Alphaproteobacteria bacterium]